MDEEMLVYLCSKSLSITVNVQTSSSTYQPHVDCLNAELQCICSPLLAYCTRAPTEMEGRVVKGGAQVIGDWTAGGATVFMCKSPNVDVDATCASKSLALRHIESFSDVRIYAQLCQHSQHPC